MLSPLQSLENVYDLNLSNNQIEDISILEILTYLSYLDISSNNITPISLLIKLPSLWSLNVANNQIQDVLVLAQIIKDGYLEYNIYNNLVYAGSQAGTVHLKELDFDGIEVWVNLSDYISYVVKDNEVTVTIAPRHVLFGLHKLI